MSRKSKKKVASKKIKGTAVEEFPKRVPEPKVAHAIIGAIEHHHVQAIAAVVPKEPVVIVALPKSTWQKVKDWLGI